MENGRPVVLDLAGRDIHAEGARLRAEGPVARVELPGGVLAWSITGYELGRRVLADERFSKDPRKHWTAYVNGEIGPEWPLVAWARMENLTSSYGEDHSRPRRLLLKAFTPRRVQTMRPAIEKTVGELLDELARRPSDQAVDLKADFAHRLSATVIGDLIGVPENERVGILGAAYGTGSSAASPEEVAATFARVLGRTRALVEAKRRVPADDLASDLILAQDQGTGMTDDEVVNTLLFLLNAGTEPSMNLVVSAVRALLTHPDQREMVRDGRAGWAEVIEETLRVQAPVAHLPFRFAVEDVDLDGVTIGRGEPILMNFAAMGRDPAVHGDTADRFDLTRADKRHLSFGHGIYRCVGWSLAWLEAEVALDGLFRRFPGMSLAITPEALAPQGGFAMNGVSSLPVRLAGGNRAR